MPGKGVGSKGRYQLVDLIGTAIGAVGNVRMPADKLFEAVFAFPANIFKNRHTYLKSINAIAAPAAIPIRAARPVSHISGQVTPTSP
jgi:hypothetical protein